MPRRTDLYAGGWHSRLSAGWHRRPWLTLLFPRPFAAGRAHSTLHLRPSNWNDLHHPRPAASPPVAQTLEPHRRHHDGPGQFPGPAKWVTMSELQSARRRSKGPKGEEKAFRGSRQIGAVGILFGTQAGYSVASGMSVRNNEAPLDTRLSCPGHMQRRNPPWR
jgi:hypothetical protein